MPIRFLSLSHACLQDNDAATGNVLSELVTKKYQSPLTPVVTVSAKIESEVMDQNNIGTTRGGKSDREMLSTTVLTWTDSHDG